MVARIDRWILAVAMVAACRPTPQTSSPPPSSGSMADIEQALAIAESDLNDAGVVVAYRSPVQPREADDSTPASGATEATTTPPEPEAAKAGVAEPSPPAMPSNPHAEPSAPPPAPRADPIGDWIARRRAAKAARNRCERVCDLATATCELRDRICDLAADHPNDARYSDACGRADDQCVAATGHCDRCAS